MKKFVFLVYHREYKAFLNELRDLGMIHVAQNTLNQEQNQQLEVFSARHKQLAETKKVLSKLVDKKNPLAQHAVNLEVGNNLPAKVELLTNERSQIAQQVQIVQKELDAFLPWGEVDTQMLKKLEKAGYYITFFSLPTSQFNEEWIESHNAIEIARQASKVYFVTVTTQPNPGKELMIDPVVLPEASASELKGLLQSLKQQLADKDKELVQLTADIDSLDATMDSLASDMTFEKVSVSADLVADGKVMLLQGWAPADNERQITDYLDAKDMYYQVSDPTPEDDVPIKFKNNKFSRLFEPIAELYMLPKYNEIDLTPYFAPFYMFFFGLSLGDIGYGLFLFLVATVVRLVKGKTLSQSIKGILALVQVLGASTAIAGLLTGGFFGFNIYELNAGWAQSLKSTLFMDNNQMFILSLVLGVIQILFGMGVKAANRIKQFGFVHALSTIGWIILLVSCIAAVLLKDAMPLFGTLHLIFFIPALILIFFFNSPGKNPFMNFGLGLWDTYNMATGLLGDILSYVRLFALGLSGGILASVFNSLATGMSPDNAIAGPIVTILIFVIGHAINIFMNTLGAIVHPVRLTFVEFYKNAEFEGGGRKYNPFKK